MILLTWIEDKCNKVDVVCEKLLVTSVENCYDFARQGFLDSSSILFTCEKMLEVRRSGKPKDKYIRCICMGSL